MRAMSAPESFTTPKKALANEEAEGNLASDSGKGESGASQAIVAPPIEAATSGSSSSVAVAATSDAIVSSAPPSVASSPTPKMASASPTPVPSTPLSGHSASSDLECARCEEPTTVTDSQAYGRNPFVRSCNVCTGNYRAFNKMMNKKGKDGCLVPDAQKKRTMWNGMSAQEKVAWFRKQKREQGRHKRKAFGEVTYEEADVKSQTNGKRLVNMCIPFEQFLREQLSAGKSEEQCEAEWRDLLADPNVHREEVMVRGKLVTCIEQFQGVQRFSEEASSSSSTLRKQRRIETNEDFGEAAQDRVTFHSTAASSHDLGAGHIARAGGKSDEQRDIHIARHMLPVPAPQQVIQDSLLSGSGLSAAVRGYLWQNQKTEEEVEAEWNKEAQEWLEKQATSATDKWREQQTSA